MNEIQEVLKWSPPILLVVMLNVLGMGLKKLAFVKNDWIPLILPFVGGVVYLAIGPGLPLPWVGTIKNPWVAYFCVGFICGGFAVWGHQVITRVFKKNGNDNGEVKPFNPTPIG